MGLFLDDPFKKVKDFLLSEVLGKTCNAIFIDLHGEATSEKNAFAHYFDGNVTCILGTHTHVPTSDHRILEKGTAYQTDVGMTGDYNSVIGMHSICSAFSQHLLSICSAVVQPLLSICSTQRRNE